MSLSPCGGASIDVLEQEPAAMDEQPTVEAFMRHLQVCLEEAATIGDAQEREQRCWQIEAALQEAILYKNRVEQLLQHGVDPIHLVQPAPDGTRAPAPRKIEALNGSHRHCQKCGAALENDLDFCPACGHESA